MNAQIANEIELHEPHWASRSAFQLVSILFFSTQAALGYVLYHGWHWLAVPLVLACSHLMHGLLIGFHEASHGMLRNNRIFNDAEGVMLGVFSFTSFTLYRVTHQTHHMHLASERDIELWPFVHPKNSRFLRCAYAFLELNAGLIFTPLIFLRAFVSRNSPVRNKRVRRRIWMEIALTVGVWAGMLVTVNHLGIWKFFLWMFFAPAFIAANLQSWRKYIEHVGMTGSTVNSSTRSIVANTWAGRLVSWTLLHEPFHGVHHQCAGLTHAELSQRVDVLEPKADDDKPIFPSYRHAFVDLLRSLRDPRVGAQWRDAEKSAAG